MFVYQDKPYRLSDRVWRTAIDVRANIDQLLDYHIPQGVAAVDLAEYLVQYLTPGERPITTKTPYGIEGSYSARRLARTEITAAAGRSTINASIINPYIVGDQWTLSASHPEFDICDKNAAGGPNGDGIYPPQNFPIYPAHPHCLCYIVPIVTQNPAQVTQALRDEIDNRTDFALSMEGIFALHWFIETLLSGDFSHLTPIF